MKQAKTISIFTIFVMITCCRGAVMTGLDRLDSYKEAFEGKRLGIIANHTACEREGRFIVDVFKSMNGIKITVLFSPEHG
ncbi:MAG: hypothetical protein ACYSTT_15525, partial [Planctomycetota bacterium]